MNEVGFMGKIQGTVGRTSRAWMKEIVSVTWKEDLPFQGGWEQDDSGHVRGGFFNFFLLARAWREIEGLLKEILNTVLEEFLLIFERNSKENYGNGEHVFKGSFRRTHRLIRGFFMGEEHTQARSKGKVTHPWNRVATSKVSVLWFCFVWFKKANECESGWLSMNFASGFWV